MKALRHAIALGIPRRISWLLRRRLTFSHPPGGVLVAGPPVQRGGLLSGVAAGFGGSSGELVNRYVVHSRHATGSRGRSHPCEGQVIPM